MRGTVIISTGILFTGALLFWAFGANSKAKVIADPVRLINSIEGPALYKAYCAVCHGSDATGNGPMAPALKVPPADLTRIAERNGGVFPMARVERVIAGEEPLPSGHGTREMPLWGPIFSQVDRDQDLGRVRIDNLTRYLMGMQTKLAASAR
jgi:mono/diheme cytochrome c family protein